MLTPKRKLALDRLETLKLRLASIYSTALCFHQNHDKVITEKYEKIYSSKEHRRLTQRDMAYFRGYEQAFYDLWMQAHIMSGYEWDGRIYSDWDSMPEECRQAIRKNKEPECKLYYNNTSHVW